MGAKAILLREELGWRLAGQMRGDSLTEGEAACTFANGSAVLFVTVCICKGSHQRNLERRPGRARFLRTAVRN
jgi:hypothetical protein